MANLIETPTYESGVYQFETTDPLMGGPNGIDNLPHRHLANRTAWLKGQVDALNASKDAHIGSGGSAHALATTASAGFMSAADKVALGNAATAASLLAFAGKFSGAIAGNGYLRIPVQTSGGERTLIVQWGSTTVVPESDGYGAELVVLPIAYPTAHLICMASWGGDNPPNHVASLTAMPHNLSRAKLTVYGPAPAGYAATWLSLGY